MAYNSFYPYYQQMQANAYPAQMNVGPAQQQQMQIQNGGFMIVKSEQEVLNYPVGCGNSVNFKIENAPYLYTKTMGFSQFDKPVIEKYRLIKEEAQEPQTEPKNDKTYMNTIDELKGEIKAIWKEIDGLKLKETENDELGA